MLSIYHLNDPTDINSLRNIRSNFSPVYALLCVNQWNKMNGFPLTVNRLFKAVLTHL